MSAILPSLLTCGGGVGVRDAAVRGPARVADAKRAVERDPRGLFFEFCDAANLFHDVKNTALDGREAGGVVAALFEPFEAFEDEGSCFLFTYVADDAAHGKWKWIFA